MSIGYDAEYRWLIVTDSDGASAIIAENVSPDWAVRLLRGTDVLRQTLTQHLPQVRNGPFIVCSCGWEHDEGDGDQWRDHVLGLPA